ncbi:MAG: ribonuclease III [Deltaproteobacteria bacterium CG11_big_fil_rev_8_21_14_0_20_49_13]|nr:MAG: ribonuclease III [Deltaproteobacteria bacterium CG11_big_fil_rev_8_21_14_0_20_49_13]
MKIEGDDKKKLKEFERHLGISFKKREHLKRALMHKSYANENKYPYTDQNERYEYLGDAVLELAISDILFKSFPEHAEGDLSKLRAGIVNEECLANLAREIRLGDYLYLGKGEAQTGGRDKPSLLSDAYEAVLGAIFLDRGFEKAVKVIKRNFEKIVKEVGGAGFVNDYKTRLQETVQGKFHTIPRYRTARESGPDHSKTFEVNLFIAGDLISTGRGASKKGAEQDAAREALTRLEVGIRRSEVGEAERSEVRGQKSEVGKKEDAN